MKNLTLIAGPCSAESEEQVLSTAYGLKDTGIDYFRAGLWKPRTHPGSFDGRGAEALPWLVRVKDEFGMKVCTEVASAQHVELCLKAGVDMLWIGARTTGNSFLIHEIAEALKGSDIPVFVKNPASRDIGMWAGTVERVQMAGIEDIGLILRGFPTFDKSTYRNMPEWRTAIGIRSLFPGLPLICDPSHIAGDRALVPEIAQKALDLGLDGLMVECHCDPGSALSDAAQQLTPGAFTEMLGSLKYRDRDAENEDYRSELAALRERIDDCDAEIISALSRRMEASRRIGRIKKENNVSILQMARWESILKEAVDSGIREGLDGDFVRAVFNEIHKASVTAQNE